ncbi:TetR/AcrR family transcriptional regulator [Actinoplanes sp. NPDC051851]|uniref:TetR/AcrR family transcriptional regulator n=1 Tax=Actinoplanes sp. NPDC051851 TaxID=3154753 RepID=UPI00341526BF
MAQTDTRTRILDAAERLFAERGFSGTSVRAVTEAAGANLAAVGYHFGSKADLMAAVGRRVIEPITAAQGAALDRLLDGVPEPSVAELVEAFARPLFDDESESGGESGSESGSGGEAGSARRSRLIVAILVDPAEEMHGWMGAAEEAVQDRYLAAFTRALPGITPEELVFRTRGILAVMAVDRIGGRTQPPAAGEANRRWALTFLAAAMSAPPTGPAR